MKPTVTFLVAAAAAAACRPVSDEPPTLRDSPRIGLASVRDPASEKTVWHIATGSPEHTTLVTAVTAAGLAHVLASVGPYTVFAPTNAAFDKLPPGTVRDLLEPENLGRLELVLRHHVTTSVYEVAELADGMVLSMADGSQVTVSRRNGDTYVGQAKILASVRGGNGIVHVVDAVLLP